MNAIGFGTRQLQATSHQAPLRIHRELRHLTNSTPAVCHSPAGGTGRASNEKSPLQQNCEAGFMNNPGSDLLSHTPTHAVPSAVAGLTSVFGMGTGVTLPL